MTVELINTGSELMLGRVLGITSSGYAAGWRIWAMSSAARWPWADRGPEIEQAVREALGRANLVLTTGGLDRLDNLTRECLARMLGRPLRETPSVRRADRGVLCRPRAPRADRPDGAGAGGSDGVAEPPRNSAGPGPKNRAQPLPQRGPTPSSCILLPGPRELRPLFSASVAPLLAHRCRPNPSSASPSGPPASANRPSSRPSAARCSGLVKAGLDLGYCRGPARSMCAWPQAAPRRGTRGASRINCDSVPRNLYATAEEELEAVVVHLLAGRNRTLAGMANRAPAAAWPPVDECARRLGRLAGGVGNYSNDAKQKLLGVQAETLDRHGAVSEPVARGMAEGARRQTGADYALSATGIAGPGGGTAAKPRDRLHRPGRPVADRVECRSTPMTENLRAGDRPAGPRLASPGGRREADESLARQA